MTGKKKNKQEIKQGSEQLFIKAYDRICKKYGCEISVIPQYVKTDKGYYITQVVTRVIKQAIKNGG